MNSGSAVKVPVQLWASERGGRGLPHVSPGLPEGVAAVDGSLPAKHEYHVVPNAGHFAFTMICPPALAKNTPRAARMRRASTAPPSTKSLMPPCSRSSVLTSEARSRCRYSARRAAIAQRRTQACDLHH
jgi:predicted dienelactone hydrolase